MIRRTIIAAPLVALAIAQVPAVQPSRAAGTPARTLVVETMKRATVFMVEKVSTNGGYVWTYLPDLSRRWGELEARDTMVWIQPPGTTSMGHLFLDAYHATNDEYYYQAAERVADALSRGQHPSGGWNYFIDFAGEASQREWYDTVGRHAWRMEEFQHDWGNATFDDGGTADATKFLLRLYIEKKDPKHKTALDKAIRFFIDSQYRNGAWPQRYPPGRPLSRRGLPDYASYLTFNDEVAAENIDVLLMCHQALGDDSLRDPIARAMHAFVRLQQPAPQPGWALQYTLDGKPAGARTYEPRALATHTTARNIEQLLKFYRLTGDATFLARIPEALDWLDGLALPPGVAPGGRTHPTFVEIGTNRPLYVHRRGSNVVNGEYYVDDNPRKTLAHYSSFRWIDLAGMRARYEQTRALAPSPAAPSPLSRFFVATDSTAGVTGDDITRLVNGLNRRGYWSTTLGLTSHRYRGPAPKTVRRGDYSETHVGDEFDTSPWPDNKIQGISTSGYLRNMSVLIRWLRDAAR